MGGAVGWVLVGDTTKNEVAATPPKDTAVAVSRGVPLILATGPPAALPLLAVTLVTVGAEAALKVKWSLAEVADVPPAVVTWTSTVAAASAGDTAVMLVLETTV